MPFNENLTFKLKKKKKPLGINEDKEHSLKTPAESTSLSALEIGLAHRTIYIRKQGNM